MNTITIKTELLMNAVKVVFPVSQKRTTSPSLNHILLSVAAGMLSLSASDSQNWIALGQIPCTGSDMSFCIPARNLRIALEYAGSEDTTITLAGGWVTIVSGRSSKKFGVIAAEEFFAAPPHRGDIIEVAVPQQELRTALGLAVVACVSVVPERNVVALEFRGEHMVVRAYGGSQYSQYAIAPITSTPLNVCVVSETAHLIASLLDGEDNVVMKFSQNTVEVVVGICSLTCLLSEWKYGSLDDGLNPYLEQLTGSAVVSTESLRASLSSAVKLFDDRFTNIELGFRDGAITVDYVTPTSEEHDVLEAVVNGPEAKIKVQPKLLLGYLSKLDCDDVELSYLNESKPVEVQQTGSHASLYMIMPCR